MSAEELEILRVITDYLIREAEDREQAPYARCDYWDGRLQALSTVRQLMDHPDYLKGMHAIATQSLVHPKEVDIIRIVVEYLITESRRRKDEPYANRDYFEGKVEGLTVFRELMDHADYRTTMHYLAVRSLRTRRRGPQ